MIRNRKWVLMVVLIVIVTLPSCKETGTGTRIGFNEEIDLATLEGKMVTVRGYMATLSPVTGTFVYLMNLPYQACPFCLPQTTIVTNTVVIYAKKGEWFDFYDGPIEVTGKLEIGEFADEFGYEYSFRVVDAEYTKISMTEMSQNIKMYGSLVQDGILLDLRTTMDKALNDAQFLGTIMQESSVKSIEFDAIIKRIETINKTEYIELVNIIRLFRDSNEKLGKEGTDTASLINEMNESYTNLLSWLNKFEI